MLQYWLLLSHRKPRSVVIPSSPEGFGFKVIGGNAVGLFVSEVKPGQKEVSQGDQILEINGQDARHMTHFEATQLLRSTRGKVHLTVMDNGASKLRKAEGRREGVSDGMGERKNTKLYKYGAIIVKKGI